MTRTAIPYSQSVEAQIVARLGGRIYGPYTGTTFSGARDTDIEHIVAKSEAHDSGLCSASAQTRRTFSNDLLNLSLCLADSEPSSEEWKRLCRMEARAE